MINKCCSWANSVLRNIFLFGGGTSPTSDTCYVFGFNMATPNDRIMEIIYNNGTQTIGYSPIQLNNAASEGDIENEIKAALDSVAITYEAVTVSRTDIGGDLFSYIITYKNTSIDIDVLDISGVGAAATTTDCSAPPATNILDSNNDTIDDHNDSPINSNP